MVCVPCIVIPFLLWFFNKYIRPIIAKFWNPSTEKLEQAQCPFKGRETDSGGTETTSTTVNGIGGESELSVKEKNGVGHVSNGHTISAGGDSKKTN